MLFPWITLAPLNGWTAGSIPAAYRQLTQDGLNPSSLALAPAATQVFLKGSLVSNGNTTNGTILATLPVGYRPTSLVIFPVGPTDAGAGSAPNPRVSIGPAGNIRCYGCAGLTDIALSLISFFTDE